MSDRRSRLVWFASLCLGGCATIQQPTIETTEVQSFFLGAAVAKTSPQKQIFLQAKSWECAKHLNRLKRKANAANTTRNLVTSIGILGAGAGGVLSAFDSTNKTATTATTIASAGVTALAQVLTVVLVDPAAQKDKYIEGAKYWSQAEEDIAREKFDDAIHALQSCSDGSAFPKPSPPPGVVVPPNGKPVE